MKLENEIGNTVNIMIQVISSNDKVSRFQGLVKWLLSSGSGPGNSLAFKL